MFGANFIRILTLDWKLCWFDYLNILKVTKIYSLDLMYTSDYISASKILALVPYFSMELKWSLGGYWCLCTQCLCWAGSIWLNIGHILRRFGFWVSSFFLSNLLYFINLINFSIGGWILDWIFDFISSSMNKISVRQFFCLHNDYKLHCWTEIWFILMKMGWHYKYLFEIDNLMSHVCHPVTF